MVETISTSAELSCLVAINDARLWFLKSVLAAAEAHRRDNPVDGSNELTDLEISKLRSNGVAQIAELFFLLDDMEVRRPDKLRIFLETHNEAVREKIDALVVSGDHYTDSGLSRDRLRDGLLSSDQIQTILDEAEELRVQFSQSALAGLLTFEMSPESCRDLILVLASCGLLRRRGEKTIRVFSPGVLEGLYREHLAIVIKRISGG